MNIQLLYKPIIFLPQKQVSKEKRKKYVRSLTGYTYEELISNSTPDKDPKIYEWWSNEQLLATMASIGRLKSIGINHTAFGRQNCRKS